MDAVNWKRKQRQLNNYQIVTFDINVAGEAGFEPTSTVLETAELPLFYSPIKGHSPLSKECPVSHIVNYSTILITCPAPTVRPPSRIAKLRPSFIATGVMSLTLISTLSPGITISTPSGRVISPVTSSVRMKN